MRFTIDDKQLSKRMGVNIITYRKTLSEDVLTEEVMMG